jgi:hypothetical protein
MIFTVSVRNILDTPWYSKCRLLVYEVSTAFISSTVSLLIKCVTIKILQDKGTNNVLVKHGTAHTMQCYQTSLVEL